MWAVTATGLAAGVVAGLLDGASIVRENPASVPGAAAAVRFVACSTALYGLAGGAAGFLAGMSRALTGRPRPGTVAGLALALGLFLWCGVRVHVRWFFGEPILSPGSLAANAGLLAGATLIALLLRAPLRAFASWSASRTGLRVTGSALFLACAVAAAPTVARGPAPEPRRAPAGARDVLLVTLDTTRADHLSVFGYPRGTTPWIDRHARLGGVDVLWATVPLTNPSHCSLLTGLSPRAHGVRNNGTALGEDVPTIVESLAAEGFRCGAFVSGIPLKAGLSGLAGGFATYDDAFSPFERVHPLLTSLALVRAADRVLPGDLLERRATHTVDAAVAWLEATPSPRFLWVHLFDPHTPYHADAPLRHRFARESPSWTAAGRPATGWPIADYDAEVRGTDRAVGRLLRAFEEAAPGGAAFVTADHGEGLLQHGDLTHGALLFEEDLRIPWVAGSADGVAPGATGRLVGAAPPRSGADVAGFLVAAAYGRPFPEAGGAPVVAETFPPEGRGRRSAVVGVLPDGTIGKTLTDWDLGTAEAFVLSADPGETAPGAATGTAWAGLRPAAPDDVPEAVLDPEVERRLRALGYVH